MKSLLKKNEFFVAITLLVMCITIGAINPAFFSPVNFVGLLRQCLVSGIMAFALMMGIIAGGIDVSFPAIAVCSMYMTTKYMDKIQFSGSVAVPIIMAIAIGTVLGFINGFSGFLLTCSGSIAALAMAAVTAFAVAGAIHQLQIIDND